MRINKTLIEDLIHLKKNDELDDLFNQIKNKIEGGDTVIIERQYINTESDLDTLIHTMEEAENFIASWGYRT